LLSILLSLSVFSCTNHDAGRYPLTPQTVDIMISRADSLLRIGEIDSAKSLYAATTSDSKRNIWAFTGLGKAALAERDWAEALSFAEKAIAVDSGSLPGHYIAAVAHRELGAFAFREPGFNGPSRYGDWARSRKHFGWILARDSSFEDVLCQFALLLRYEGDRDGALDMDSSQIVRKPELVGPQVGRYGLFRYFMFTEDSTEFVRWLEGLPGSMPRYFRAETFRRHGNFAAAESILTLLLKTPGDVSLQAVRIALARLRFAQGDRSAAEAEYWNGVNEVRSSLGSAILFEDLKYIVSDGELTYFNSLDSVSRQREFFRSFWNFRNPSLALKTNLRIQEHIRRFLHAEKTFEYYGARTQFNNPDRLKELRFPRAFTLNDEFNDMGMIYMRQGDPDDIVRHDPSPFDKTEARPPTKIFSGPGTKPREEQVRDQEVFERKYQEQRPYGYAHDSFESWLFNGTSESPRMMFNFQKHNAVGNNWRLVAVPALDAMIDELRMWDSKYQRLYAGMESDRVPLSAQMTAEARDEVHYALSTERQTWEKKTETFRFPHAIDVFRAPDGQSLIDVSYAIPLASLSRGLPDSVTSIPVEIGFSLVDAESRHAVTRRDTIQVGLSRTRTGAIIDLIRCTVPPDSYAVSMHIRPLLANMIGTWRQTLRVADFSRARFMMSSVQFLRPSTEKSALEIDGVKVVQSPFQTQSRTEPLNIYFQVYHLVADMFGNTSYRTECVLLPRDEDDIEKGIVVYKGEKTGRDEMATVFCQIDVHSVNPGQYYLIVSVTDRMRVQTLTAIREVGLLSP
jgi:tetratricopeptide (TPR) repeat protein